MTQQERTALIASYLGVARPMSDAASELVDEFRLWEEKTRVLDPAEELRLLAELQRAIAGRLVELAGGR